ncbi:MAG TPA: fibronectin type III domain-containing protein, partial [Candidatus Binatia bacterium]|nr:fibronectin type III domain-containing protein [Candidatus Binatia bacterium]
MPLAPEYLTATAVSSSQINLAWRDTSFNETGFILARSASSGGPWFQITTTAANGTHYSNSGLSAGTTYYYRVAAFSSRGNSANSAIASATTFAAAPCTYTLSSASASIVAGGGGGFVGITAGTGCAWSATTASSWIHTTSTGSGS